MVIFVFFLSASFVGIYKVENVRATDGNSTFVDHHYNSSTVGWGIDHFSKIQDAINAVNPGDMVYVYNGIYYENVIVNKSITLAGESKFGTIITGGSSGDVVCLSVDGVNITDFTIQNSGRNLNNSGFKVLSDNNIIEGNMIIHNSVGIFLQNGSNNTIRRNIVNTNTYGIGLEYSNSGNSILGNYVTDNNITGIYLSYCLNNTIRNNSVHNNTYGMALLFSSDTSISDNILINNSNNGLNLYSCTDITFIRNTLITSECAVLLTSDNKNIILQGNVINNNALCGIQIHLKNNNNITIYNNILTNCTTGIYVSADATNTHVYGNLFSNNKIKILEEKNNIGINDTLGFVTFFAFVALVVFLEILVFTLCYKRKKI